MRPAEPSIRHPHCAQLEVSWWTRPRDDTVLVIVDRQLSTALPVAEGIERAL